ncbi:MAG: hypothetical protein H0U60_06450 [Blastocatellia bacterium]|nr:hypothetical protein [Blastocatellia bacterium]
MPVITTQSDRVLCPAGPHILKLFSVELREMDDYAKTGKTERLIWTFYTKKINPEDSNPWEVSLFTGTSYGPQKAKLTWLLDMLCPGITKKEAEGLDTEDLIGTSYKTQIKHTASQSDASKIYAEPLYLEPLQPSPFGKEARAEAEADEVDPFADP